MTNLRIINGLSGLGSTGAGHVSNLDQNSFESAMGQVSQNERGSRQVLEAAQKANESKNQSTIDYIKQAVVDKKNEMIMSARGKAFKSAAELTKEISF